MRFRRLDLVRFGSLEHETLDFAEPSPGLHLIHGPNEAGKSTALRAVSDLLFGIPHRTSDDHTHAGQDLEIRAEVEFADGRAWELRRRKGRKHTLLAPDDTPIDEDEWSRRLGGISREVFERMFGFDHMRLIAGGRELLEAGGRLQEALFGAAAGLSGLHQVVRSLEGDAAAYFKPGGKKPPLNEALRRFGEARSKLRQCTLRPTEWMRLQRSLEEARSQVERTRSAHERVRSELEQRSRLLQALPDLRLHADLTRRREQLGRVVKLEAEARERRIAAENELRIAARQDAKLADEATRLEAAREQLEIPSALLSLSDRIKELEERFGAHREAQRDREKLSLRRADCLQRIELELRALPGGPSLEQVERLRADVGRDEWLRPLLREGHELETLLAKAREHIRRLERDLEAARARLEASPPAPASDALEIAARTARGSLETEARIRNLEQQRAVLEPKITRLWKALPFWQGELTELQTLPIPTGASIERLERELRAASERRQRLEAERARLAAEAERIAREREEWAGDERPPTREEVAAIRAERDALFRSIRAALSERAQPPAPPEALIERFEHTQARADELADRRFAAYERAVQIEALDRRQSALEFEAEQLAAAATEARTRAMELEREWHELWAPCGIEAASPAEMREFREQHRDCVTQIEALRALDIELASARNTVAEQMRRLAAALSAFASDSKVEAEPDVPAPDLTTCLGWAENLLDRNKQLREDRQSLRAEVDHLELELRRARDEEQRCTELQRSWRERVGTRLDRLGLARDASIEEAEHVLARFKDVLVAAGELRGLDQRIEHIAANAARLQQDVDDVVREAGLKLAPGGLDERVHALARESASARQKEIDARRLSSRLHEIDVERAELERDRQSAQAALSELMERASVDDPSQLPTAEDRAEEAEKLDAARREARERIARAVGDVDEWAEASREIEETALRREVEALQEQEKELLERLSAEISERQDAEHAYQQQTRHGSAAEAAAEAEQELASIASLSTEYARLRLAAVVLQREMRRYAEQHQGPILARSSEYFARLTGGSFARLCSHFEASDRAVLMCERPSGSRIGVDALSEGTRDQLFLCLRLAALEHHTQSSEPLPMVLDDILMTFDDARSLAALELLGELSQRHQILFFTHHTHLLEVAARGVPHSRIRLHSLDGARRTPAQ